MRVKNITVKVKTLSVGNKPMPMSFFRQVKREEPNWAPCSGRGGRVTNGKVLGFVDYRWAMCGWDYYGSSVSSPSEDHVHLVWTKDGELRSCCIDRSKVSLLPQLFLTV